MGHFLGTVSLFLGLIFIFSWNLHSHTASTLERIKQRGELLWGSDAEGGAPYVFPDPTNPSRLIGFEVDLAEAIARELGVKARQSQNAWDSLIPALERGDFDLAMNGIEITPQRESRVLFSLPLRRRFTEGVSMPFRKVRWKPAFPWACPASRF